LWQFLPLLQWSLHSGTTVKERKVEKDEKVAMVWKPPIAKPEDTLNQASLDRIRIV
jgi:hypothetical protein